MSHPHREIITLPNGKKSAVTFRDGCAMVEPLEDKPEEQNLTAEPAEIPRAAE